MQQPTTFVAPILKQNQSHMFQRILTVLVFLFYCSHGKCMLLEWLMLALYREQHYSGHV